jgi:hypothetical protein
LTEEASGLFVRREQRPNFIAQLIITCASAIEKDRALISVALKGGDKQIFDLSPSLRLHK